MLAILVASSKGGCGKSTISTELAGYFALAGKRCAVIDADPQHSSLRWCARRADLGQSLQAIDGTRRGWNKQLAKDTQRLVIDTPAGSTPKSLQEWAQLADAVLVPVTPSPIDLEANYDFVQRLRELPVLHKGGRQVGLVLNRLKPWTRLSQDAEVQLRGWPYPQVAGLRDSQAYALLAGLGRCLFDYNAQNVRAQQEDWMPLFSWLREVNRARHG